MRTAGRVFRVHGLQQALSAFWRALPKLASRPSVIEGKEAHAGGGTCRSNPVNDCSASSAPTRFFLCKRAPVLGIVLGTCRLERRRETATVRLEKFIKKLSVLHSLAAACSFLDVHSCALTILHIRLRCSFPLHACNVVVTVVHTLTFLGYVKKLIRLM